MYTYLQRNNIFMKYSGDLSKDETKSLCDSRHNNTINCSLPYMSVLYIANDNLKYNNLVQFAFKNIFSKAASLFV